MLCKLGSNGRTKLGSASLVSIMAELGSNDSCIHCSENGGCMLGSDDGCKLASLVLMMLACLVSKMATGFVQKMAASLVLRMVAYSVLIKTAC